MLISNRISPLTALSRSAPGGKIDRGLSFNHARFIWIWRKTGLTAGRSTINRNTLLDRYHSYAAYRARPHQRARRVTVGRLFELAGALGDSSVNGFVYGATQRRSAG